MAYEPSLDDVMGWLRTGRLAPDSQLLAEQQRSREDFDYRARAMREAFRSEAGQVALQTILQATLFRSPVDHSQPTETQYLRYAQLREGQNQAAATILAYLDHAETLETEARAPASIPAAPGASDLFAGWAAYGRAGAGPGAEPGADTADPSAWLDPGPGTIAVTA